MSQATTTVETPSTPATKPTVELGVFGGKYGPASEELFTFLTKQYSLTPSKAHRISHAFACDYGAAMAKIKQSDVTVKSGKTSKDGLMTLRESVATIAKNVEATPAMQIAHAVQWLGDAGKHGLSYGKTEWTFSDQLEKFIADMAE